MKTVTFLLSACLIIGVAGCNTVDGAGRDVESGGEAISNTAREAEGELAQ